MVRIGVDGTVVWKKKGLGKGKRGGGKGYGKDYWTRLDERG